MHGAVTLIVALVWISGSVFSFFAIFDARRHRSAAWEAIGQSRIVGLALLVVGLAGGFFTILSVVCRARHGLSGHPAAAPSSTGP